MLRGIHPLLSPDLLHVLASMGHGDRLAIVDANFPATRSARRLIQMSGMPVTAVLGAVLTLLPIDDFEPDPAVVMQVVGDPDSVPPVVEEIAAMLDRFGGPRPSAIDRFAFYAATEQAFAVVQTGERRFYGNVLLTKGVIPPP